LYSSLGLFIWPFDFLTNSLWWIHLRYLSNEAALSDVSDLQEHLFGEAA